MPRPALVPGLCVLAAGGCLAAGLLSGPDLLALLRRVLPVLGFLAAATVLAEVADRAQVFDAAARTAVRLARGRTALLFAGVVVLATACTVLLSLDTTAVLLTPAVLALAAEAGLAAWPLALTVVWLAGTASLLLPVSNLTNLLAADRLGLAAGAYARGFALPAVVAVVVTMAVVVGLHGRALRGRCAQPAALAVRDPVLLRTAGACCLALVPLVLLGLPPYAAAALVAVVALGVALARRAVPVRDVAGLLPAALAVSVLGLFVVVDALGPLLLDRVLGGASGSATSAAVAGALLANGVDNLPAYLALERVVPREHLPGLLLGVDLGPLVTPWGSLATLLWAQRCRARGLDVSWGRFAASGLLLVPLLLLATVPLLGR
ncbi:MAG: arsenite efflux rane protein ArsB [Frankiales bacterium]|nr:arsenite efflux rane protein ArsB [Frankiales bacterium]